MSKVGNARLLKLASFLEEKKFAPGKFHLGTWMAGYGHCANMCKDNDPARDVLDSKFREVRAECLHMKPSFEQNDANEIVPVDCKTAGCAVGWGIAGIKSFRKAGLNFVFRDSVEHTDQDSGAGIEYRPKSGPSSGYVYGDMTACALFFGLDDAINDAPSTTAMLFCQDYYSTKQRSDPKAVAKRIRIFLDGDRAALYKAAKRAVPNEFPRD